MEPSLSTTRRGKYLIVTGHKGTVMIPLCLTTPQLCLFSYLCEEMTLGFIEERLIRIVYPLDVAKLARTGATCDFDYFKNSPVYSILKKGEKEFSLSAAFKTGIRVIDWKRSLEELKKQLKKDNSEVYKHVYVVTKFNQKGYTYYIYMHRHIDASKTKEDEKKVNADKFDYLIEHKDFEINELGEITFKK